MKFKFFESGALDGGNTAGDVDFAWQEWWNGLYQQKKDLYFNDNIGFRPDFVRVKNQLELSLFGIINADWILMDKNQYLYYSNYLDEYTGKDYWGEALPRKVLPKLKRLQDTLEHMGKTVVLVYAPSKPYYFAHGLSINGKSLKQGDKTNFKSYFRIGDSLGIHQIDMNRWYVSLKAETQYPLFSKQSIHYTIYGALYAVDSIIKYIEHRRGIKMLHPAYHKIEITPHARKNDDDAGRMLNIVFPIEELFYYPELTYGPDTIASKPKAIYIGDSFIWPLLHAGIMNTNTNPEYWHYCKYFYNAQYEQGPICCDMNKYDWLKSIQEADCIILVYTATQLVSMQNGFIDRAYQHFYPAK